MENMENTEGWTDVLQPQYPDDGVRVEVETIGGEKALARRGDRGWYFWKYGELPAPLDYVRRWRPYSGDCDPDCPQPPRLCWPCPDRCDCWCRVSSIDVMNVANHHPQCCWYEKILIPVWKITLPDGTSFYDETKEAAEGFEGAVAETKIMPPEVFDRMKEFDGP